MTRQIAGTGLLLLFASIASGAPTTPEKLLEELRRSVPTLASAENVPGYQFRQDTEATGNSDVGSTWNLKRAGDKLLFEKVSGETIGCLNNEYMFAVTRVAGGSWSLTQFHRDDRETKFWDNLGLKRFAVFPLTALGTKETIRNYLDNPSFRLTSVQDRADGLIESAFAIDKVSQSNISLTGTIVVDPNRNYVVTRYSHVPSSNRSLEFKMVREFDGPAPMLKCKSIHFSLENRTSRTTLQKQFAQFDRYSSETLSDSNFTIEHYGIPSPEGKKSTPRSNVPLILAIAALLGALGLGFVYLRRRSLRAKVA